MSAHQHGLYVESLIDLDLLTDGRQAGAFAGLGVNLVVFPLDTVKTRLQSSSYRQTYCSATGPTNRALWRGLYGGVGPVVLVAVPSSGIFFTTYESMKFVLGEGVLPQPAVHALSSSIAQLANCAIVTPVEVLKQNAQMLTVSGNSEKRISSPTMQVIQQMKRHPTRLWRGYTALVARDLPFTALQFPVYENLKKRLLAWSSRNRKGGKPVTGVFERGLISAISAGVAGSAAAWVTTPLDVVKTRMMLEAGATNLPGATRGSAQKDDGSHSRPKTRRSGFQIAKEVCRTQGIPSLFRGGLIRAGLTLFGNGLFMGCYEGAKLYLEER